MQTKTLYVVFSATPMKMGSMIRAVTLEKYNHISLSFDPHLKTLYSYARYYKKAPLYGGLVRESAARYKNDGKTADIFVCAIPISKEQCRAVKQRLKQMFAHSQDCRYNMFSAATSICSRRIFVPNCFTCVEFVANILSMVCPEIEANRFYSIEDVRQILKKYEIYAGKFPDIENEIDSDYEREISLLDNLFYFAKGEVTLLKALYNKK